MIEEGLVTFILADTTIAGKIVDRLYGKILPQKPTFPAMVYARISGERMFATEGETGLADGRFQIDCYASGLKDARELAAAVRKRLSGYKGAAGSEKINGSFLENDQDLYESAIKAHRVQMDFSVWYNEATS